MELVKKMRIVKSEERSTEKGKFFICQFLDEDDDKYSFFVNEDFYNKMKPLKKYEAVDVKLNLYTSKNGRYGLGVL